MIYRIFFLLLSLALAACGESGSSESGGDDNNDNPSGNPVNLTLRLADAPGDLAHAWVEIVEMTLQGEDDDDQPITETLFSGSTGLVDLLPLASTTSDLVVDQAIPAGIYDRMTIEFGDIVLETTDGEVIALAGSTHPDGDPIDVTLECPTCNNANPNVAFPDNGFDFASGDEVLILDFDVRQSFGRNPVDPDRWYMVPVIYAVDETTYGAIEGTVTLDTGVSLPVCGGRQSTLADFIVIAYERDDSPHSGRTQPGGDYVIDYVPPDRYGMIYHSANSAIGFEDEVLSFTAVVDFTGFPIQVVVPPGGVATMDYIVTSASCTPR